jgi:nickel-dependent lactate racemase
MEFFAIGTAHGIVTDADASVYCQRLLDQLRQRGPLRRVLLLPPDITRYHSHAGFLTTQLYCQLVETAEVLILPTVGTHVPMTRAEQERMFPGVPADVFRPHDWRNGVVSLGEVPAEFIRTVSEGKLDFPARVEVDRLLVEPSWDAIISVGQLVPHEVIGIANHNKNVFVGAGGSDLINKSHWLGAVYGMERIMGRAATPVRAVLNYASEHLAQHLPLVYLLTVRERMAGGAIVTRGLFAGDDAACYLRGAELCRQVNLNVVPQPPSKVVVYLQPDEFRSTWLGNKAIYRTRLAIADAGELVILAPGVKEFGEDHTIDRLIRQYGYRGTPATLDAVRTQPELAANLSAAAHLIHGSSEERFRITYCPGHLDRTAITNVGFEYGDLATHMQHYQPERLTDGWNTVHGEEIFYVSNPGLGLWGTAAKFGTM